MKLLVSGSNGLVGKALVTFIKAQGDTVVQLVRSKLPLKNGEVAWDPMKRVMLDASSLEGLDAVVHLAGEGIATGRWTPKKKEQIWKSRVEGTHFLSEVLCGLRQPPKTFLCASAIGFYGDRGDEILVENSAPGNSFLSKVCQDWERATEQVVKNGIRIVNLRFGLILSNKGGALDKMLFPFRLGLGGKIGSGRQYMSWIALDDVIQVIQHALSTDILQGPINVVAPNPVTNLEFTKTLGRVLYRPTIFSMPAFAARLAFGEMADELFLASTRVQPLQLLKSHYSFNHPELEEAIRSLID